MLDDVQRRYDAFPLRGNPDPNFLSIIDDIEKTFKREYGPNVFLSMEHIRFGDEWVKWKLSGRLMSVLMAREEERGLETWSYEEVRAAERVAGYWEGLRGMFAEEEEEAEAEVMGQVEVQEDGTEVEVDDEDEIEEDDSDEEGSMYDETDVEDGPVARE
ncbi:hypothetical protein GRF29_8g133704 [Pseudopithomyces chartarum]|uniref:Uncharacterized protein n=1 Tax=Pseudopithomyces chartarum TaxID=1892770 RepID=A0AAN6M6F9_9PLEO|nr:hypothetical protein GRF29_8g133704 [Pseudopithomyces chartarum]